MNSPSSATHRHRLFIRYMGKNGAGKDARARGELAREPIVRARPNVLLHFVFRLRMRQLSPLTHRSSIRFCTQSCGGKNKKDFGAGFGGSAHPEQRLNRASIADRSIHRRLLLHRRRAPDLLQPLESCSRVTIRSSRRYASFWRGISLLAGIG